MRVLINPASEVIGKENAILTGSGATYHVRDFEGSLSLKSVVRGSADWETNGRRYAVNESTYLILNDRQHYTLTIDSPERVTTFCLFFARGFVEEINTVTVTPEERLLDCPGNLRQTPLEFFNRLETQDSGVLDLLRRFQRELASRTMSQEVSECHFLEIGALLVRERRETLRALNRLPAARPSTRGEVYRRLLRGRDFMLASMQDPICLKDIAAAACLSPFHFHRSFMQAFRETPHQYLTRQRLEVAARLLRRTKMSITEVGFEVGLETSASFSDLFRRHYGMTPSQYRRSI
jgi:AraC family transcriptional regulator